MFAGDVYYETTLSIPQQLDLLGPLLRAWIGEDWLRHYIPGIEFFYYRPDEAGLSISVGRNASYGKSDYDNDRFRYRLTYMDGGDQRGEEQNLQRLTQILELLWSQGIPTCTPGWTDELPNGGGEEGPVRWP